MLIKNGTEIENDTPFNICLKYNADKKIIAILKDGSKKIFNTDEKSADELCELLKSGSIESLHSSEPSLEDVFLKIAKGGVDVNEAQKD